MRAIIITRAGGPEVLEVRDRPGPEPAPGEILVRVRASALNRADLLQRRGGYPAPHGAPTDIPGLEYAGEVVASGASTTLWPIGSRVMGIIGGGAHAEFVCVHEREAIPVPDGMSWEEAGAVPEVFLTAWDGLVRGIRLVSGERVLIHAVGSGVGTAALQIARLAGATVVGTSRTAAKLQRARELGLEVAVEAREDWPSRVEQALGRDAVHAVLDLVGGRYLEGDLRVMAPRGRLLVVGLVAGARAEVDAGLILRKRLRVGGTVLRSRPVEEKIALARDFAERAVPLLAAGRLRPVIDRVMSFDAIAEAHAHLESNASFGKVVLRWE